MDNTSDFIIENGVLKKYIGPGGNVALPEGLQSIGGSAFRSCWGLTGVTLPEGLQSIGDCTFWNCKGLTSVTLPEGLQSIGNNAFSDCAGLTGVTLPEGLQSIGDYAFSGCTGLTSVTLPEGLRSIGRGAFSGCKGLTSVTLPEGLQSIGDLAFWNCEGLTSVALPEGLRSIGGGAFRGCRKLADSDGFVIMKSVLFDYTGPGGSVAIPEGITGIASWAFYSCGTLTDVTLPGSVTELGSGAFAGCYRLGSFKLRGAIPRVGTDLFAGSGEVRVFMPAGTGKTTGKLPTAFASAARSMDEEELAWVLLYQTAKGWRTEAAAAADTKDCTRMIQVQLELLKSTKKLRAAVANNAADTCITLSKRIPDQAVKELVAVLRDKGCSKEIAAIEKDPVLLEKLRGREKAREEMTSADLAVVACLESEGLNVRNLGVRLQETMGLKSENLPNLLKSDGKTCAPFVLAWLLTVHESIGQGGQIITAFDHPGLCPEAEQVAALLDPESLQAAIISLADEHLKQYQNTKKKYLAFPICRYADDATMAELTKRAPKWRTTVSGNDAPPLLQLRMATKYSNTHAAMLFAERYHELDKYAALRGMTEDEMRDRNLSDVGLDAEGGKKYDLGNQSVTARLQKDLSFLIELPSGKTAKSLPKKGADPEKYGAANKDFLELKKMSKKIVKNRGNALFEDFLSGRERPAAEWRESYLQNPLLRTVAKLVVWAQGDRTFIPTDTAAIDSAGQPYTITDGPIRIAHPMEMGNEDIAAWQRYLTAHTLRQPFSQIWEPVRKPEEIKLDRYAGCMIPYYRFHGQEKRGITVEDYDFHNEIEITLSGCQASIARIDWYRHEINMDDRFEIREFGFEAYTRQVNHIVAYLDRITVWDRVRKDDISVMELMSGFTLAQITEFITAAQDAGATNVLAALLEYKNANFADFDPMAEFTLEW